MTSSKSSRLLKLINEKGLAEVCRVVLAMPEVERDLAIGTLNELAQRATRLAVYLGKRDHLTHQAALNAQNKANAALRKALGYAYHNNPISWEE